MGYPEAQAVPCPLGKRHPQVCLFRNVTNQHCGCRAGGREGAGARSTCCAAWRHRFKERRLLSPTVRLRLLTQTYTEMRGRGPVALTTCWTVQRMLNDQATHLAVLKRKEEPWH